MPRLIVIKGADENKSFELTDGIHGIGRDASNQIRLHDTEVSRRHAEIHVLDGVARLKDVGSANGSFLNNVRISEVPLQSGDHIQIGQSTIVFSAGRHEAPPLTDLADKISMITRHDLELSSAIVKSIGEAEGSRILARPDEADTVWLKSALANLGIMYETIQAVSHILDLDQLLERIMELIFRSIEADRGCIMLKNGDSGLFEPKALRWRSGADAAEKLTVSRTIMEHVLREKQGVLVSDAARDERFRSGQSIIQFGIREVICVPMKGRNETLGVLYLDTRGNPREVAVRQSITTKFTGDHLALAIAIGHLAALAIEETRYHQAMLQAERLAAIGLAVAALSHHIKNILQGLNLGTEMLGAGLKDMDENYLRQGWKIVRKNQGKVNDLVLDMLNYSKEREPGIEDTDVNELVRDVIELLKPRAGELGVALEMRVLKPLPLVPADREGIHRSLLNIVGNALDAVEESDSPRVVVSTEEEADTGWLRIVVADNGVGIPPEKVADIFKPFVSTKGSRGTGLGLAVSRKVLREHGGDIVVESKVGKGSRFIIRLPRVSPLANESIASAPGIPMVTPEDD